MKPLPRAGLGKVLFSVNSSFTECGTLDTETLGKDVFVEWQTLGKGGSRERAVSDRLKLTAVSFCRGPKAGTRQRRSLPNVFYVSTLCRPICTILKQL